MRELTAALAVLDHDNRYRLFVAGASPTTLPPLPASRFEWKPTSLPPRWLARLWHRARIPLPVEYFTGRVDLYHATDFVLPPTLPATRTLLTVHDLSFVRVPETSSPPLKAYLDAVVPRSVANADHVLADSAATKRDLIELYRTPEEKITVLYSGVNKQFQRVIDRLMLESMRGKYRIPNVRYVLSVGTVQPRKNYSRVIQAIAAIRARGYDLHYVIVGGKGWLEQEMRATIENSGMADYVHLLGFVDDVDLPALYSDSRMLVMASLYEGFGLPVLEAMACGAPVIASNVSSLPEIAGDAALLVDPFATDAIRDAILEIESDEPLRSRMIGAGYEQASRFSWQRSVAHLMRIYARLLDG